MIKPLFTLSLVLCLAQPLLAGDSWRADPSGQEPGTLALWKFDDATDPGANTVDPALPLSFARRGTEVGASVSGRFDYGFRSLPAEGEPSTQNDSFAEARDSASLFHSSALTVDFWYQPSIANLQGTFFDKKRNEPAGIRLFVSRNNSLIAEVGNGSTSEQLVIPNIAWPVGEWTHLAVTFENRGDTAVLKLYRDGAMLGERLLPSFGDLAPGPYPWRIANRRVAAYASRPGDYDNFRISSQALSFDP